jgi:hypothetical protein
MPLHWAAQSMRQAACLARFGRASDCIRSSSKPRPCARRATACAADLDETHTTTTGEVLELLPLGVQVVGSYGCSAPPPLPPLSASGPGCPAVGVQRGGAGFTLDGEPAAAEVVAPAQAGALALPGFVVLR